jgi:hypothetical protein
MPRRTCLVLLLAFAGPARADDLGRARERGNLAIEARAILRKYCADCHGENLTRTDLSVLDHKQLIARGHPVPFVNLDDPAGRSQVIEFLEDGSMPPGGRPRPTPKELDTLKKWVGAKAPSYPKAFDDGTTLAVMLDDWSGQPAEVRPYLRYLSLTKDGEPLPNLADLDGRLQKAILAASRKSISPDSVDDTATLFRIDIRALGWAAPDLFVRVEQGQPRANVFPMVAFDLILLEYPHGFTDPLNGRLREFLGVTKQLRPVPFLRADWFADTLAPKTPLADDLASLVQLAEAWAKRKKDDELMPCGPAARPFLGARPVTVPAKVEGRTPIAPLGAWYAGNVTPEADTFGLKVEVLRPAKGIGNQIECGDEFYLRVSAERDARIVLLNVLATGDVGVIPLGGGTRLETKKVRPIGSAPGKPFVAGGSILTGRDSEVEHWVLVASDADVPPPVVVRSRHDEQEKCKTDNGRPVWRFVFDERFDATRAERKVVPIIVKAKP